MNDQLTSFVCRFEINSVSFLLLGNKNRIIYGNLSNQNEKQNNKLLWTKTLFIDNDGMQHYN